MARDNITDKSNPPKSLWFNGKYRVTPETSKLLQEAVFKDGGYWRTGSAKVLHEEEPYLYIDDKGEMIFGNDEESFERKAMPEKPPPQPNKEFQQGKWYKCIDSSGKEVLSEGTYYRLDSLKNGDFWTTSKDGERREARFFFLRRFDVNPESDFNPDDPHSKFVEDLKAAFPPFEKSVDTDVKESKIDHIVKVTINRDDFFTRETTNYPITKEEVDMSNQNRVVSVKFFDDDAGLKAEQSLVAEYQITTRVSDAMTVSKVLLTEDVAGDIAAHNEVRAATVDLHILKQTGNKVMLQAIEFEDLRVEVRQV